MKELKRELNDEQLSEVSGGAGGGKETKQIGSKHFTGHVDQYHGIVGNEYYVTFDEHPWWFKGRLEKSWEETHSKCFNTTDRKHLFTVTQKGEGSFSGQREVYGGEVTLYTNMY